VWEELELSLETMHGNVSNAPLKNVQVLENMGTREK
jgi:hypothetical protein